MAGKSASLLIRRTPVKRAVQRLSTKYILETWYTIAPQDARAHHERQWRMPVVRNSSQQRHRVQRSASKTDIGKSIQYTAAIQYAKTLYKRRETEK
jgi:hypothetical protein